MNKKIYKRNSTDMILGRHALIQPKKNLKLQA